MLDFLPDWRRLAAAVALLPPAAALLAGQGFRPVPAIHTVFIVLIENMNWSEVKGSWEAPYLNNTLLPAASHAEQYYGQPGLHPSEPNYLWLEAGSNFGLTDDNPPAVNHQATSDHLVSLVQAAGLSWKAYVETVAGGTCPVTDQLPYSVAVNPTVFFDDVTGGNDPGNAYCIAHEVPFANLDSDLAANKVANLNWLIPNLCDDGHSCPLSNADTWLKTVVTSIQASAAYQNGGAIFITWDETDEAIGLAQLPIGLIVASPAAKGHGYSNAITYTHASTLRTICEIFGLTPPPGAAKATDLSDLFQMADPDLAVTPSQLNFGNVSLGGRAPAQTVTLTADGNVAIPLASISATAPFTLDNDCPATLAAGANCNLQIGFVPSAPGGVSGVLTVNDDAPGSPQQVALRGTGSGPVAALSPSGLNFGAQAPGTVSGPRQVELSNSGNAAMTISQVAVSGAFRESDTCTPALPAGASCTASVTFAPSGLGSAAGKLTFTDNAGSSPQAVTLGGEGVGATVTLTPATVDFGAQPFAGATVTRPVTLTNTGNAPLSISGTGASGGFLVANGCGSSLAAGASCTAQISFTPGAVGVQSGIFTLDDNAPGSPQSISLTATTQGAIAALSPATLDFGSQPIQTPSAPQGLKLTNNGNSPLVIHAIAAGGDFSESDSCQGAPLPAGASCAIQVTYTPTTIGASTSSLAVTDDSTTGTTQTVALRGNGLGAGLSLDAATLSFAPQVVGTQSPAQVVALTNTGNAALGLGAIATTGDFTQGNDCGPSLAAGAVCHVSVTFAPQQAGSRAGALQVAAATGAQSVTLAGTASDLALSATSTSAEIPASTAAASFELSLAGINGFTDPNVGLSCTTQAGSCSATPPVVSVGDAAVSAQIHFNPPLPSGVAGFPSRPGGPPPPWIWSWGGGLPLLAWAAGLGRRRIAWLLPLMLLAGCGGAPTPAAPLPEPGTYTVQVTATASAGISRQITLTVVVE